MEEKVKTSKPADSFHRMLRKVYEDNKTDEKTNEKIEIKYDDNIDDFFHPNNIFNRSRNFPTLANVNGARCAAERIMFQHSGNFLDLTDQESHTKAAKLLFLSQANAFQHRIIMRLGNKLMKMAENPAEEDLSGDSLSWKNQREQMVFESFDKTEVIDKSVTLPPSWTIVQISGHDFLVSRFRQAKAGQPLTSNPALTLVRMSGGSGDLVRVVRCEAPGQQCSSFLQEFQQIKEQTVSVIKNYHNSVKNDASSKKRATEHANYWSTRANLEARMKSLVNSMEESWLGHEKAALLGSLVSPEDQMRVRSVVEDCVTSDLKDSQRNYLEQLLSGAPFLSDKQLGQGLSRNLPHLEEEEVQKLIKMSAARLSCLSESRRHPVILILDSEVQSLPWESLPSLRMCHQAVSRVPSLPFLYCLWSAHLSSDASVLTHGVAQDNVYYVLNPDKSLGSTEEKMKEVLKRDTCSNWEGVVGEIPEKQQLTKALQEKDCFMYCGHGSGSQYLSGDEIERLRVRGVPLLLGCSSAHLERMGRTLDPLGISQSYLVATSPALLGFLWAITDVDLDNWTAEFLEHWLGGKKGGQEELLQAVADKRMSFKRFTNSAALVVYGLPIRAKDLPGQ